MSNRTVATSVPVPSQAVYTSADKSRTTAAANVSRVDSSSEAMKLSVNSIALSHGGENSGSAAVGATVAPPIKASIHCPHENSNKKASGSSVSSNNSGGGEDRVRATASHQPDHLPLSLSSRGLESTAFTDEVDEYDAVEEADNSISSCADHGLDTTVSTTLTGRDDMLDSATECRTEAARRPTEQQEEEEGKQTTAARVVDPLMARHPFSSLTSSTTSWSAMRKLRLEAAQSDRSHASQQGSGRAARAATPVRGFGALTFASSDEGPAGTRRDAPSLLTSSVGPRPHHGVPLDASSRHFAGGGGSMSSCSGCGGNAVRAAQESATQSGKWTLAPRLRGVNEILLTPAPTSLFREALDALQVWKTPVLLDLHHNSAGGTYMVRAAPVTSNVCYHCARNHDKGSSGDSDACGDTSPLPPSGREVLCIFKPRDEEIGQETNPHGNRDSDRTDAFAPGSGSRREVLAYRLDHGHRAGVPPTVEVATTFSPPPRPGPRRGCCWVPGGAATERRRATGTPCSPAGLSELSTRTLGTYGKHGSPTSRLGGADGAPTHPQIGSLQLFLRGCQEAADVLPGRFDAEEVHALAIFDIRTLNGDRHGGNVLVQRYRSQRSRHSSPQHRRRRGQRSRSRRPAEEVPHLIPIDHSYICPSGYADPDYEWLSWPQAKQPFSASSLQYIAALDAEADAELVRAALLAHSSVAGAAATAAVAGCGRAELFDVSTCTNAPRGGAGQRQEASATTCAPRSECASERGRALLLDDGVRHACAIAQECGVTLRPTLHQSLAAWPAVGAATDAAALSGNSEPYAAAAPPGQLGCCGSLSDLTIFSPVRNTAQAAADPASPLAFSTTAVPEPQGSPRRADYWAQATAELLAFTESDDDDDDGDEVSASVGGGKGVPAVVGMPEGHARWPSVGDASSAAPSLFFTEYAGSLRGCRSEHAAPAVTYDTGAASAAAEVMRCTTRLLQIAALEFHMSAYEIGSLCRRPRVAQASTLEELMEDARDEYSWEVVLPVFDQLVRRRLASMPVV